MTMLESKIIRKFSYVVYLFGSNFTKELIKKLVEYLESVYNVKLSDEIKQILLSNTFSKANIDRLIRQYQYMIIDEEDVKDIKLQYQVCVICKESINELNTFEIKNDIYDSSIIKSKDILKRALNKNLIIANYIYALVNQIGLFGKVNQVEANKYFYKNSLWNHEDSLLCLAYNYFIQNKYDDSYYWYNVGKRLEFDFEDYDYYIDILKEKVDVKKIDTLVDEKIRIHEILKDERCEKTYNMDVYNPEISKILYEGKFSFFEKQRLMFTKKDCNYTAISLLCNNSKKITIKPSYKYNVRLDEQKRLVTVLNEMIESGNNNPLIITCQSKVIMELYSKLIEEYFKQYVVLNFDAVRNDVRCFDRTYSINNYIYQNIVERQNSNVCILHHNLQELSIEALGLVMNVLNNDVNYLLQDLEVSIDRSRIFNIIFSMNINELDKRIVHFSNVFTVDNANEQEKEEIIKVRFLMELEHKGLSFKDNYIELIKLLVEKVNYSNINEAITKIVSKLSLSKEREITKLIHEFINNKVIGF